SAQEESTKQKIESLRKRRDEQVESVQADLRSGKRDAAAEKFAGFLQTWGISEVEQAPEPVRAGEKGGKPPAKPVVKPTTSRSPSAAPLVGVISPPAAARLADEARR